MKTDILRKGIFPLFLMVLSIGFSACSEDEDDTVIDSTLFAGLWCMSDESGEIIELSLTNSHVVEGYLYCQEEGITYLNDNFTGTWFFYPTNDILVMHVYHPSTMQSNTISYKVVKLDDTTLQIRNQELGNLEAYYHLADSKTLSVGGHINIGNAGVSSANKFYSSNNEVVSVDNNGNVTALQAGMAYILTSLDNQAAFVKINVESRAELYGREVCMYLEDVMELRGTPDVMTELDGEMIVLYKESLDDADLVGIQYYYDANTHEITRLLTAYKSEEMFERDLTYVRSFYYEVYDGVFGLWEESSSNDYTIRPIDEQLYFVYFNTAYGLQNGHY